MPSYGDSCVLFYYKPTRAYNFFICNYSQLGSLLYPNGPTLICSYNECMFQEIYFITNGTKNAHCHGQFQAMAHVA